MASDVDLIRERINIVDLIAESVQLKKAGRNLKALCPFHNEKTPSFIVSPERQIWRCFGCGKGGDVFTFLMELDRLEFPEALKILADRAGVKLEYKDSSSKEVKFKENLLSMHHLVEEYYHYVLAKHRFGERARRYLKERGVSDQAIRTFGLGFAPEAWDNVVTFLKKKGFREEEIETSGLAIKGKKGWYDRFRSRIIFPLKNYRGRTIAFSGRLIEREVQEAKYINSPETPLYVKGETLYGLDVTKEAIRKQQSAVVVEGEFDVISSYQAGVPNVVAIKGSALTPSQVNLLKRFAEHLILALDQDSAGDAASRRGIEIADQAGFDIRVVRIPQGKDPDEAARASGTLWKKSVETAIPFYDFILDSAFTRFQGTEAFDKKKISDEVLPIFAKIDNAIVQAHYFKLLATRLGVHEETIVEAANKLKQRSQVRTPSVETKSAEVHTRTEHLEEHILALIIQMKDIKQGLDLLTQAIDPSQLSHPVVKKIFMALIDYANLHGTITIKQFVTTLAPELISTLDRAYVIDTSAFVNEEVLIKELSKSIEFLKKDVLRRKMKDLTTQIQQAEVAHDETRMISLQDELSQTIATLKRLT